MPQREPPPEIPVISWQSPRKDDLSLTEWWNSEVKSYNPLDIGASHPNTREYPGYKLGIQAPQQGSEKWVRRTWIKDGISQDEWNYQLKYSAESASHPIFIRAYRELKETYAERTRGSALQVVYKLKRTNNGSGYDPALKELALTFSGGSGSGASGRALIAPDGTIRRLVIDSGGDGYTSAPTFTIPAPVSGVTATGTAYIQPTGAILVKEEPQLYPVESENYALYFNVLRIYETLPGPLLTGKEMSGDAQGAIATTGKQKLAVGAADYVPTFKTLAYSDTPIDANTKERQTLEMTDSAFPILTDYDQDPEMQSLITTTFQVVDASAVVAPSAVAGVITRYKHIDKRRSLKIVETYATPASYDEQDFDAATFPALFDYTLYSWSDACGAFSQIRAAFSTMVKNRVHISFGAYSAVSGLTLIPVTLQLGKGVQVHEGVLVDSGSFTYAGACTGVVSFTGSSPDYSTYTGSIQGSEQLVSGSCKLWKAGLFRKMELFRTML